MTYADLQQSVATRLNRPDFLAAVPPSTQAVIPTFIQDRILYYQKALYAPSELLDYSITTIQGQSIYVLPLGMQALFRVRFLLGSIWVPLARVERYDDLLQVDVVNPPILTLPSLWATYGQTLRLYPTPVQAYPIEIMGNGAPPAPVLDTDDNFWTEEAATLIIKASAAEICSDVINNPTRAAVFAGGARIEAHSLLEYTQRLRGPTFIQPHW